MQIPAEQGDVQIYVYDAQGAYIPFFYVGIWSDKGDIKFESRLNDSKAKSIDVAVTLPPLKTQKGTTTSVQRTISRNAVFDQIQRYAREQFERIVCYNRYPKVEIDYGKTKGNSLVFTVTDLCRVVLKEEKKSLWCRTYETFGGQCNDITRERLEFTFNYEADGSTGYHLTGEVKGLFGSGVYKPRVAGYMDMEPDFNDYLTDYANTFQYNLKNW